MLRALLFIIACTSAHAAYVPGRILVKPVDAMTHDDVKRAAFIDVLAHDLGTPLSLRRPMALGWLLLDAPDVVTEQDTAVLAKSALAHELVDDASVDHIAYAKRVPNDPLIPLMWHLDAMRMPAAWDHTVGDSSVRVAVVDSGVIDHEDLDGATVAGFDFISDADVSDDGDGRDGDPVDSSGDFHGTHVAGIIAARGDNGVGVVGMSWHASLVVVRVLGSGGSGVTSDIAEGTLWAGGGDVPGVPSLDDDHRASVVNLSLGIDGAPCSGIFRDVFRALSDLNVIAVAAAGNEAGPVNSPGNCGGVIAVAASDNSDALASYSSFGPEVDVVAPGGDGDYNEDGILSTTSSLRSDFDDDAPYGFLQGTSMATPTISGVVALLKGLDPSLRHTHIEALLRESGRDCALCQGKKIVDAGAAVALVVSGEFVDAICTNTCALSSDGVCDDGRAGAGSALCDAGTDCDDCDPAAGLVACTERNNSCRFANDGECDDPTGDIGACPAGTDSADCGRCLPGEVEEEEEGEITLRGGGLCGQGVSPLAIVLGLLAKRRRRLI